MAVKEIVKGHCGDSKCTYDVYTKEKIDELLNATKDYATLTGVLTIPTGKSEVYIDLPENEIPKGFTSLNSVVIAKAYSLTEAEQPTWAYTDKIQVYHSLTVWDGSTTESLRVVLRDLASAEGMPITYKIVLMKIA